MFFFPPSRWHSSPRLNKGTLSAAGAQRGSDKTHLLKYAALSWAKLHNALFFITLLILSLIIHTKNVLSRDLFIASMQREEAATINTCNTHTQVSWEKKNVNFSFIKTCICVWLADIAELHVSCAWSERNGWLFFFFLNHVRLSVRWPEPSC